jgi:hypothetical protein
VSLARPTPRHRAAGGIVHCMMSAGVRGQSGRAIEWYSPISARRYPRNVSIASYRPYRVNSVVCLVFCEVRRPAPSWPTYPFASNIVIYIGRVFKSDVDKERRCGEEIRMNPGDGTCEFVALRRPDGLPDGHDVPWHGV